MDTPLHVVILAAGQGTRMKSQLPKVLHHIGGKPMVKHVTDVAKRLNADSIHVVYGHGGDQVQQAFEGENINWVLQAEQKGTGHAMQQVTQHLPDNSRVLILYGDVPLIKQDTLASLLSLLNTTDLSLLTVELANPSGYGRIVRNEQGIVQAIVEEKDATVKEKQIIEINTGMMAVNSDYLKRWLNELSNDNAQGEYYLTDIIAMAVSEGIKVETTGPQSEVEVEGVNNKSQLSRLERAYQLSQAEKLMELGVTFIDPSRFDLRGNLTVGNDVVIDVNVVIEGEVSIGDGSYIASNNVIIGSQLGERVQVNPNCVIENSTLGNDCVIGPFARIRPDTQLSEGVKIGNFVEIKKSIVAQGSKVNHLSYIGDTLMGKNVNIGAGTITCNYDGANKHKTVIGDNAFIGSDTQLVAPVEVGENATIGAGSTITHDAPANDLTLSRSEQKTRKGWKRPVKNKQ